ncbi:MAG: hypothetical protein GWO16_10550, partial [Gammaproteobacteria bacterium]|nr:hypothetical protein [Gammaproteobacteria bacterium]NIR30669.1 hypothetical protein [Gammaproteobacteria bacterium]NIV21048.1 hypothetical protein [Gammaproteobacteria bacterium]NIV74797.1 hypothetical protein [Gammaproteobacteria bacterium]
PPADQSQEERVRAARDADLVLRDESDEIIDNLKQQLSTLQKELERFQGGADAAGATERAGLEAGLAPHIASRLQMPADELSGRLERLL